MAAEADKEDDLDARGLIAHSYDSLFSIRKRIRKINDLHIPVRGGISTSQAGAAFVALVAAFILLGFIITPITRLLGIHLHPIITFGILLGLPFLAAQRVAAPMAYGKSISGTISSAFRFWLDDPVHRRGVPIKRNPRPDDVAILHYQRDWVMADNYAPYVAGEADLSDPVTEARMDEGPTAALQRWMDDRARQHVNDEAATRAASKVREEESVHHLRGTTAHVYIPEAEDEDEEDRRP